MKQIQTFPSNIHFHSFPYFSMKWISKIVAESLGNILRYIMEIRKITRPIFLLNFSSIRRNILQKQIVFSNANWSHSISMSQKDFSIWKNISICLNGVLKRKINGFFFSLKAHASLHQFFALCLIFYLYKVKWIVNSKCNYIVNSIFEIICRFSVMS